MATRPSRKPTPTAQLLLLRLAEGGREAGSGHVQHLLGEPLLGEGVRLVSPALGLPTNSLGDLELHVAPPGLSFLIWRSEKKTPTLLSSQVTPCLRCWDGVSINHLLLSEG